MVPDFRDGNEKQLMKETGNCEGGGEGAFINYSFCAPKRLTRSRGLGCKGLFFGSLR